MQTSTDRGSVTALLGAAMFSSGITFASTLNYAAIVGIDTLGIPNGFYSMLLMAASLIGAAASLALGHLSDRVRDRRVLVIGCALAGALGFGLIFWLRSPLAYIVSTVAIMPFGMAVFSQSFSFARSYYNVADPARAEFMNSVLKTIFSVAWAVVPPLVGWVAATTSVFNVYGIAALSYLAIAAIFMVLLRNPAAKIGAPARRDAGKPEKARVDRTILVGTTGVVLILLAVQLNTVTVPLLITSTLRASYAELGWFAGIAAAIELPCILGWGYLLRWVPKYAIIVVASVLYAIYLVGLSQAQSMETVLWLQLINGPATAALLSIPISYMQDAIRNRVGLSTSLLDTSRVVAVVASALIFGVLTAERPDYPLLFVVAAAAALAGAAVLVATHRLIPACSAA